MATRQITHVSRFDIGKSVPGDWPCYHRRIDQNARPGSGVEQLIEEALAWPDGPDEGDLHDHGASGHRHGANPRGPERFLDIEEHRAGACVYVFRVNVYYGGADRLQFCANGPRFIKLPLNSTTGEDPIEEIDLSGSDPHNAAFLVDTDRLRASQLAARIKQFPPHNDIMRIPFYFNVEDPGLQAAPWVFTDHSRSHGHPFTHGGVHPIPVAMLNVELDAR